MRALLFLLVIAGFGGAGYEFYLQQKAEADFVQKRQTDLPQIAQLTAENKQMQDDNDQSQRELSDTRAETGH